ncbi:MAG TPA: hypothetical protein VHL11_13615 [Phototrophicaceae bacterium]|nr:hypothetical protein [Phototrophicaceae bacterium]
MLNSKYVAEKFVAPSPAAEQMGHTFAFFFETILAQDIDPILQKHGLSLSTFDPNQWYRMQTVLNVMQDVYASDNNVSQKLVSMGIRAAETFPIPPEAHTVKEAIQAAISMADQMYRNVPRGFGQSIHVSGDRHLQMFSNVPFADDSVYGAFWGIIKRYKPEGNAFVMRNIDNPNPKEHPGTCYDIKWGATSDDIA